MNLREYEAMDEEARRVIDELGDENARDFVERLGPLADAVRAGWEAKGVEYITFPQDGLDEVVDDAGIQALRQSWIDRATAAGVPGEEIASELQ
jgi:TRAP-type C4-dicarboxylate transport system substrate-binding protein